MYTKEIFNEWIKSFSKEKHHKIQKSINDFANKNDYVLSQKNMIFRIKITEIEFSVVKLKFPDQK